MVAQLVAIGLALALMYGFTRQTILQDARSFVEIAQSDMATEFAENGLTGIEKMIRSRLASPDGRDLIVLLKGPDDRKILGNLAAWPTIAKDRSAWQKILLYRENATEPQEMGIVSARLPGGYMLITGQILEAEQRLNRASQKALFWSALVGLLGTAVIMIAMEYLLENRISQVTKTADAIHQGDMTRRVERNATGDAFDRLGSSVNRMLARIERLVGELRMVTDSMAHDLRSPVARVKAGLERAISETSDERAQLALRKAVAEADQLNTMLNTALQISRAEAGMGRDQFATIDIGRLLGDAAELYGPLAEGDGFEISVACPTKLLVFGHTHLLMQAVTNLIENALRYATAGTGIRLQAAAIQGLVEIRVVDNGPGIAEADRAAALQRFGRLDTARGTPGAGLGLSLVETIARMHNGSFALASNDGGGLCAILRLGSAN